MSIDPLKIAFALVQPLTVTLFLALLAALISHWFLRALAIVACLLCYAISTPLVAQHIAGTLSDRYPPQPVAQYGTTQAIVLLGGGVVAAGDDAGGMDATAAVDRVLLAARLWHAGRAPRIVVSGGDGSEWTQAHAMRALLVELGVSTDAVVLEPDAVNTRAHPALVRPLLEAPDEPFLLVTSAMHMPRAMARFRAAGLRAMPAPADIERLRHGNARDYLPHTLALDRSTRALKERLGMLHMTVFGS
ncbi:YdcF family protein [Algiphilus sp.]|uniref:YdcF family protein n=1 Tax=Algiphilus sp. TaxID=1872431 RepID=UPI0025C1AFEA|nr:YdcF family protein [Algiphilus sp.]MCK5770974.1 YdcF family protein [Algiphilus sp.]